MTRGQEEAPWRRRGWGNGSSNTWGATTAATWGATWSTSSWEAYGQEIYTPAKSKSLGGEWAVVGAMIFIFVIGFALGCIATYITAYTIKSVQSPPPAGPAVEAHIVTGIGRGKQASITRRPVVGTMPTQIFITKMGDSFHCEGCSYLGAGDRAGTKKTFARCNSCFRDP
jgi:hypothetical protein